MTLLLVVGGAIWFEFGQPFTAHALVRRMRDSFDHRPGRRVLILGNSRTFYHDMPDMVRDMADSAGDLQRYDITVDAQPGASLETLWSDPQVRGLLAQRWSDVIVQGESRAESSDAQADSFQDYGARLIDAVRPTTGAPWLVVNWNYDARLWEGGDPDGTGREAYYQSIQSAAKAFSDRTGARLANIGRLWADVARAHPEIVMTEDGNHPSIAGSYLFALLLYGDLSKRDVGAVTYAPAGLDVKTATELRSAVAEYEMLGA